MADVLRATVNLATGGATGGAAGTARVDCPG